VGDGGGEAARPRGGQRGVAHGDHVNVGGPGLVGPERDGAAEDDRMQVVTQRLAQARDEGVEVVV